MADWRKLLLERVGAPSSPQNLRFLQNWQRWEGGHTKNDARYNWLNTTHGPGSPINSVGVKRFGDLNTGIRSMAETLMNGRYDDIVAGLVSGNPYTRDLSRGLSVWVSGSPTAGAAYARKVMGMGSKGASWRAPAAPAGAGRVQRQRPVAAAGDSGRSAGMEALIDDVWGDLAPAFRSAFGRDPVSFPEEAEPHNHEAHAVSYKGKKLVLPTTWKSTHPTSGLESEGFRSAIDIMGRAGTPVGAPEAGTILRWGSAQGGSSIWFKSDGGRIYWIGHLDNIARPGTRVRRGQVIARISADHPRPHVHLDRKG